MLPAWDLRLVYEWDPLSNFKQGNQEECGVTDPLIMGIDRYPPDFVNSLGFDPFWVSLSRVSSWLSLKVLFFLFHSYALFLSKLNFFLKLGFYKVLFFCPYLYITNGLCCCKMVVLLQKWYYLRLNLLHNLFEETTGEWIVICSKRKGPNFCQKKKKKKKKKMFSKINVFYHVGVLRKW